jgi:acyl-CoA reductase-like NAD-dependent aldehyde dehydrogenase
MKTNMIFQGENIQGEATQFSIINPANEQIITQISSASLDQVGEAIASAVDAFQQWQHVDDEMINTLFLKIAEDIRLEADEIAQLITLEQGKPLALAQTEVAASLYWIEYLVGLTIPTETIEEHDGKIIQVFNRPLGVVASITPWNWPFMIAVWHIFPALKAKNCVVNKPSEYTPLSTIKLVEIMNRHLPAGVCNILLGKGEVGQALAEHPDIEKVVFTGSTATGKNILYSAADTLKSVVLELGGNDVGIVLEDVDIQQAADAIFASSFLNAGQTCASLKRLYVQENVYDLLIEQLVKLCHQQTLGDGLNSETTFGPVQNKNQYIKVKALIDDAVSQGGTIITSSISLPKQGYFIAPTLITNVHEGILLVDEEQFGPVLPILKFNNIDEVLNQTNKSYFGLAGSVWSKDIVKAQEIAARMQTGTVWINSHSDLSPAAVFGGWKYSGQGYSFGLDGLLLFTQKQAIHLRQ